MYQHIFFILSFVCLTVRLFGMEGDASFAISAKDFHVETNSEQPGEGIQRAVDGNPKTIWHTKWNESKHYPYLVDFLFNKEETVNQIDYLPRQDYHNGHIRQYSILYWKDGDWVRHASGSLEDNNVLKTLRFPTVSTERIRLEITEGRAGFASAAEFTIYRVDADLKEAKEVFNIAGQRFVASLFGHDPGREPTGFRQRLLKLQKELKSKEALAELEFADALLKSNGAGLRTIPVLRKRSDWSEKELYKLGCPWSCFQPTGFAVQAGKPFDAFLDVSPSEPKPNLVVVDWSDHDWNQQDWLNPEPGPNILVSKKSGVLYVVNKHEQKRPVNIRLERVIPIPFYRYGRTTPAEWRAMCEMPNPVGIVEISSNRVFVTVSAAAAGKYLTDPKKLCETFDTVMNVYARLLGLSPQEKDPNGIPKNLMHLIEVKKGTLYATNHRTAFPPGTLRSILDHDNLRVHGWGPWHEIGHMHQMQEYKFQGLGEVTVNLFSLEVQHHFGGKARIDTEDMRRKITNYFSQQERNYHDISDVFMKVAMFWQLRLAFGDRFYPLLHRFYRTNQLPIKNDEDKAQYFFAVSSLISGYDLTPFFLAWGLLPNERTRQETAKQKKLGVPIWENTNFSDVKPEGTVGIAKMKR